MIYYYDDTQKMDYGIGSVINTINQNYDLLEISFSNDLIYILFNRVYDFKILPKGFKLGCQALYEIENIKFTGSEFYNEKTLLYYSEHNVFKDYEKADLLNGIAHFIYNEADNGYPYPDPDLNKTPEELTKIADDLKEWANSLYVKQ